MSHATAASRDVKVCAPADPVLAMEFGGQGVVVDFGRDGLVESGIEDGDLGHAREDAGGGIDAGGIRQRMGRSQGGEITDFREDLGGDEGG